VFKETAGQLKQPSKNALREISASGREMGSYPSYDLKDQQCCYWRKIESADRGNEPTKRSHYRVHNLIEQFKWLLMPTDVGKPAQKASDYNEHGKKFGDFSNNHHVWYTGLA
jgi:hypothetical protein